MTYREEQEEKPIKIIHEWRLLPKLPELPAFNEYTFYRVAGFCLVVLMLAGTFSSIAVGGMYIYDWRMGRHRR